MFLGVEDAVVEFEPVIGVDALGNTRDILRNLGTCHGTDSDAEKRALGAFVFLLLSVEWHNPVKSECDADFLLPGECDDGYATFLRGSHHNSELRDVLDHVETITMATNVPALEFLKERCFAY